jgi:hypothetical protein
MRIGFHAAMQALVRRGTGEPAPMQVFFNVLLFSQA